MLKPQELIRKKRNGLELSALELEFFFNGFLKDEVADYQVSAMLMAIFLQGMTREETVKLTLLNVASGHQFKWNFDAPIVADKHSTGGVGDKTSLVILPLAILSGLKVPMMAGRGLGHTGGTLDKLEAIPGMNVFPSPEKIKQQLKEIGGVFMGQTSDIAALDKRLYALRDVTATVESIPLITASILSKKLAEGLNHLVLDIKFGSGAFISDLHEARKLTRSLLDVGKQCGLNVCAVLSSMNSALGDTAGHILEVQECLKIMRGEGSQDTKELSLALTAEMVRQAYPQKSMPEIMHELEDHLSSGRAFKMFCKIIAYQGGDTKYLENPQLFPQAEYIKPLSILREGYIKSIDTRKLGLAILSLGGGRTKVTDVIDFKVGLSGLKRCGTYLAKDAPLVIIHAKSQESWQVAAKILQEAIVISETPPEDDDILILERMY